MKAPVNLVIGTRGSRLALWQSRLVQGQLERAWPELTIELRVIRTKGDRVLDTALSKIGDKGLFTREIENELLAGRIDLAVHSLKDLPTETPDGLKMGAITGRVDAADALVSKDGLLLEQLPAGAEVLTSSLRRRAQLLNRRSDLRVSDVRGNIETRLRKLDEGSAAAMVMAIAALKRLELIDRVSERLDPMEFLPACGQGALALEMRVDDGRVGALVRRLDDPASRAATTAERAMLARMGGGCQVPIGAYARIGDGQLHLRGMVCDLAGRNLLKADASGDIDKAEPLGERVAEELLEKGGRAILSDVLR